MRNKQCITKSLFGASMALFLIIGNATKAQDAKPTEQPKHKHEMKETKLIDVADTSSIRKGVIDLKAIDKNGDGKVFQDQMDWNVISDTPGRCPICKMTLGEVSLDVAKKNLLDAGYKVKEKKSAHSIRTGKSH
jgi:hypothetical protein